MFGRKKKKEEENEPEAEEEESGSDHSNQDGSGDDVDDADDKSADAAEEEHADGDDAALEDEEASVGSVSTIAPNDEVNEEAAAVPPGDDGDEVEPEDPIDAASAADVEVNEDNNDEADATSAAGSTGGGGGGGDDAADAASTTEAAAAEVGDKPAEELEEELSEEAKAAAAEAAAQAAVEKEKKDAEKARKAAKVAKKAAKQEALETAGAAASAAEEEAERQAAEEEAALHAEEHASMHPAQALRSLAVHFVDPSGFKLSLEMVLLWPCTCEAVKSKAAAAVNLNPDSIALVLHSKKLPDDREYPEEGLRPIPALASGASGAHRFSAAALAQEQKEAEEAREREVDPPYPRVLWIVVPIALPGSPMLDDQSSVNNDETNHALAALGNGDEYDDHDSLHGVENDDDNGMSEAAAASDARAHWSKKTSMMPNNNQSFNQGKGSESDDSRLPLRYRKKHFDLARELRSVDAVDYLPQLESLGCDEFSSFSTITLAELSAPGFGIPRPAQRRIATLAAVYMRQMNEEDNVKAAARLQARAAKASKKKAAKEAEIEDADSGWHDPADEMAAQLALFNSDEDLSVASSSQVALQKPVPVKKSPEGKWTVDGVYFFATYKELQQAWKDADVVHRADLPTAEELDIRAELAAFAATAPPGAASAATAGGDLSEDALIELDDLEREQPNEENKDDASSFAARMAGASLPDPAVLDAYMKRLMRPPTPPPLPPPQLRPHGVRTTKLCHKIRRRTARDEEYQIPLYSDAQIRVRCACCAKHGNRCKFWRERKGRDLSRAVANFLDDALTAAAQAGHGHVSKDAQADAARKALHFFKVQFDSAQEEDEEVAAILVAANPSAQPLGFQQSAYVDAVIQHAKRQFHDDNPILKIPAINKHLEDA